MGYVEMPIEIFCCYARKDHEFLQHLKAHLMPLQREGIITIWSDTDINAGKQWEDEITKHLNTAQIILLLVSPDFMMSEYIYSKEMKRAIERHKRGEATVIPIILRWVSWQRTPIGQLQALPKDGRPIKNWQDEDEAFYDTVEGIIKVIEGIERNKPAGSSPISSSPTSIATHKAVLYQLFFADLLERLKTTHPGITNAKKTQQQPFWWFGAGKTGFNFEWIFTKSALRTGLSINIPNNRDATKKAFDALFEQQAAIEKEFGQPLVWERLEGKESRISLIRQATIADPPDELEQTKQWAVETMLKFVDVFKERIKMLPT